MDQAPTQTTPARPVTRRKVRLYFLVSLGGLLLVGGVVTWHAIQQPASGTVQVAASKPAPSNSAAPAVKILKESTFSLSYPSTFIVTPSGSKDNYTGLDNVVLAGTSVGVQEHIAISVIQASGGLANDPAYRLRKTQPTLYTETLRQIGTDTAHVMTQISDHYEQTVFVEHQGLIAAIAQTSTDTDTQTQSAIMSQLLASWQWSARAL